MKKGKILVVILILFGTTLLFKQSHAQTYALDFDGSNDYVSTTYNGEIKTLEFWFKTNDLVNTHGLCCQRVQSSFPDEEAGEWNLHWGWYIADEGKLRIYAYEADGDGHEMLTSTVFETGRWYHIAITSDASNVTYYVNGVQDSQHPWDVVLGGAGNDQPFLFGGYKPNGTFWPFNGLMDEIRLWSDVRTITEIQEYICEDVSGQSNLIAYYRMTDGSGTSLSDNSTNSYVGTLHDMDNSDWVTDYLIPSGDGTTGTEYQIQTLNHLYWLSQNSGEWGKLFEQTADIDMTVTQNWNDDHSGDAEGFSPIGNSSTQFTGSYDGQGYTISNLTINRSSNYYNGIFGYIIGSTIENLGITEISLIGGEYSGGLVGHVGNSSTISNCYSTGSVSATLSGLGVGSIGGLIGRDGINSESSTINDCYSTVTVTGYNDASYIGGLIGTNYNGIMNRCYATGNVSGEKYTIGGLVGNNGGSSTMNNCYSKGNVSGSASNVGGLVGYNGATINTSYSMGSVTGSANLGGLIGSNSGTITNSFWDTQTSGQSSSDGGTGKTTTEMKNQSTFSEWSPSIWYMDAGFNDGYPYLLWQNPGGSPLPIELSSFTASVNINNVTLNWSTAWEINNAGFDIERQSLAGRKDIWTEIGFVEGYGTTNEPKNYSYQDRKLNTGEYNYRLVQRDYNNRSVEHFLSDVVIVGVPNKYKLSQNYPNPFNPKTKISFELPGDSKVNIKIFDMLGREVATLLNGNKEAGYHIVEFDGSNFSSGMYFYRIHAESFEAVKRMLLIK